MEADKLVQHCIHICEEHQALDILVVDISRTSPFADYCLFCSGNSQAHVRALARNVEADLKAGPGVRTRSREGEPAAGWVLLDLNDVLVHIFKPETRAYYAIEQIYRDCPVYFPDDYEMPAADTAEPSADGADAERPAFLR